MAFLGIGDGKRGRGSRARRRAEGVQAEWDAISNPGQFDSSGGPPTNLADSGIYDEFGNTVGLPGSHIAPDVQHGANVVAMRRNDALVAGGGAQAQQALRSGLGNMLAYRPGGAAAMTSGYYSQMAQQHFNTALARQQQAPDLMFRWADQVRKSAEEDAKKAGFLSGGLSLAGMIAGMALPGANAAVPIANAATQAVGNPALATQQPGLSNVDTGYGPPTAQGGGTQGGGGFSGPPQYGPQSEGAGMGGGIQGAPSVGGVGGQKQMAPGAGPGQPPAGGPGPQGGGQPQGGAPGAGAPAGPGGQAAPGGEMGMAAPAAGPFTARLAAKHGMDPQLFSRSILALFDPMPSAVEQQSARLAAIMANDIPGSSPRMAEMGSFRR